MQVLSLHAHCLKTIPNIHLDLDKKVCQNLDITLENDDEHKKYGGDYQYIGTVELSDGSGQIYPILRSRQLIGLPKFRFFIFFII